MTVGQSFRFELRRIYWTRQSLRMLFALSAAWLFGAVYLFFTSPRIGEIGAGTIGAFIREVFGGLWVAIGAPAAFIVMLLVAAFVLRRGDLRRRDPQRRFTRYQRREGMTRAKGRCELESRYGKRCTQAAEHGDHFYPWSKGGATSLRNFVAACSQCNRRKGARIPSPGLLRRLERRRASYVGAVEAALVGERRGR
nr:HNH endonuclease signature motif containing protein [Arthrobacter sp. D5-1]